MLNKHQHARIRALTIINTMTWTVLLVFLKRKTHKKKCEKILIEIKFIYTKRGISNLFVLKWETCTTERESKLAAKEVAEVHC